MEKGGAAGGEKGFISQAEVGEFAEKLFEQFDTKKIPGFLPSPTR